MFWHIAFCWAGDIRTLCLYSCKEYRCQIQEWFIVLHAKSSACATCFGIVNICKCKFFLRVLLFVFLSLSLLAYCILLPVLRLFRNERHWQIIIHAHALFNCHLRLLYCLILLLPSQSTKIKVTKGNLKSDEETHFKRVTVMDIDKNDNEDWQGTGTHDQLLVPLTYYYKGRTWRNNATFKIKKFSLR